MLRDFAGAIADLDSALQLKPNDAWALRSRGEAKSGLGDFAGAIADLDLALQLEPDNARALRSRGEAKRMLGDSAGAIADLDLALQLELRSRGEAKVINCLAGQVPECLTTVALHLAIPLKSL